MAALKESTRLLQEELKKKSEMLASLVAEVDTMKSELTKNSRSNARAITRYEEYLSDLSESSEDLDVEDKDDDWDPDKCEVDDKEVEEDEGLTGEVQEEGEAEEVVKPSKKRTRRSVLQMNEDSPWSPSVVAPEELWEDLEEELDSEPKKKKPKTPKDPNAPKKKGRPKKPKDPNAPPKKKKGRPKKPKDPNAPKKPKTPWKSKDPNYKRIRPRIHKCPECDYLGKSKYHVNRHMVKHTGDKPYPCQHCEFRATRKFHLTRHIQARHQDERKFQCSECKYAAKTNDALKNHMTTHSSHKSFICEWCEHPTKTIGQLRSHCKGVHGVFVCGKERVGPVIPYPEKPPVVKKKKKGETEDGSIEAEVEAIKEVSKDIDQNENGDSPSLKIASDVALSSAENGLTNQTLTHTVDSILEVSAENLKINTVSTQQSASTDPAANGEISVEFYRCSFVGSTQEQLTFHMMRHQSNHSILCEHCTDWFSTWKQVKEHTQIKHEITIEDPVLPNNLPRRKIREPRKSKASKEGGETFSNSRSSCAFIDLPLQYINDYLMNEAGPSSDSAGAPSYSDYIANPATRIANSFTSNPFSNKTNGFMSPGPSNYSSKANGFMSPSNQLRTNHLMNTPNMLLNHHQQQSPESYYGNHGNYGIPGHDNVMPSIGNMFRKNMPVHNSDISPKLKAYPGLFH